MEAKCRSLHPPPRHPILVTDSNILECVLEHLRARQLRRIPSGQCRNFGPISRQREKHLKFVRRPVRYLDLLTAERFCNMCRRVQPQHVLRLRRIRNLVPLKSVTRTQLPWKACHRQEHPPQRTPVSLNDGTAS